MSSATPGPDPRTPRHIALGHLGSAVGHHVINAFSAVVSNAEMLRLRTQPYTAEELAAVAESIIQTSIDASSVARRLIDFTRPVTDIGRGPVRLDLLLSEELDRRRAAGGSGVTWVGEFREVPPILGNAEHLLQMFDLLTTNAIEAAVGAPLTIAVRTELDARDWVALEISDDGPGMEPSIQERAIEPFFTTKPGHIGVGLSIANGIWRRHRGTLSLRSRPGEGTTLRLGVDPRTGPPIPAASTPLA